MSVHTTFAPLSPSLFTPHQILYSAPLMLAQQQHIWLGKRYVARWIHVVPKLNRHPIIKQHSANHEPTMRQPKLNSVPTITQHCAKYHPTMCQPCPSSNIVPTITKLCANHQCRIKVARGPWHILSAGPLRRGLATFASPTRAKETVGAKR